MSTFAGSFGLYVGKAQKQAGDAAARRARTAACEEPTGLPGLDYMPMSQPEPTTEEERIWQAALREISLQMARATFDTWVRDTRVISRQDGTVVIGAPNEMTRDWLVNRLTNTIERTLAGILGEAVTVEFAVMA